MAETYGWICPAHGVYFPRDWRGTFKCPAKGCAAELVSLNSVDLVNTYMDRTMELANVARDRGDEDGRWRWITVYLGLAEAIGFRKQTFYMGIGTEVVGFTDQALPGPIPAS